MNNLFNTGDAVKLKTGSLQMMVKGIAAKTGAQPIIALKEKYECVWYDDGARLHKAVFPKERLEWLAPYNDMLYFSNYE